MHNKLHQKPPLQLSLSSLSLSLSLSEVFCEKGVLRNFAKFTGKHLSQGLFFTKSCRSQACNFIKKESPAQMFSCGFCEFLRTPFFYRTPPVAASEKNVHKTLLLISVTVNSYLKQRNDTCSSINSQLSE